MVRYIKVVQRDPEWFLLRAGKPTSSNFSKIITPKTGQLSKSSGPYMAWLLAEQMLGHPILEEVRSDYMQRGQELEDEAIRAYEFQRDCETDPGGFVLWNELVGCSPDRLVGDDGLLEIKCPSPQVHMGYLLTGKLEDEYNPQLQGQLFVTDRKWVDVVSYHPQMPAVVIRATRNEPYQALLQAALCEFAAEMQTKREQLEAEYGAFPPMQLAPPPEPAPGEVAADDPLGVSEADVALIWEHNRSK